MQNYGPDQSQGQFWVAVCDVVIPDIYKFDLMTGNTRLIYCIFTISLSAQTVGIHFHVYLVNESNTTYECNCVLSILTHMPVI